MLSKVALSGWRPFFCGRERSPCAMTIASLTLAAALMFAVPPRTSLADDATLTIVGFGDSLMAGYGLPASQSFPNQLQKALDQRHDNIEVLNSGVSGDTTAGGLQRFDWAIPDDADAVILELGANDALRGVPIATTERNLRAILDKLKVRGLTVLVAGVPAPSNWGDDYQAAFSALFKRLAKDYGAVFHANFVEGAAMDPKLSLSDGLHPNGDGVAVMVERILPKVEELIARAKVLADNSG